MARLPRIVIPNIPHHVTQRGNRRMQTFFEREDYEYYLKLMSVASKKFNIRFLAYCLMPNHIHLLVIPPKQESLRLAISYIHEKYSKFINEKKKWKGHLWQGRFFSVPLDAQHFEACVPYIELNPVRAGLIDKANEYEWSSAYSVQNYLNQNNEVLFEAIRKSSKTGRPCGSKEFIKKLEEESGVNLTPQKRGVKAKKCGVSLIKVGVPEIKV